MKIILTMLFMFTPVIAGANIMAIAIMFDMKISNYAAANIYLMSWGFEVVWILYVAAGLSKIGEPAKLRQLFYWPFHK